MRNITGRSIQQYLSGCKKIKKGSVKKGSEHQDAGTKALSTPACNGGMVKISLEGINAL